MWSAAHTTASWLSKLENLADNPSPQQQIFNSLLDQHFPSWRAWACWQPDVERLKRCARLNHNARSKLQDIIDLDGPDFENHGRTLGKSLPTHKLPIESRTKLALRFDGSTHEKCLHMAEQLLRLAETVSTDEFYNTPLFVYMMKGPDILKRRLDLLEVVARREFATIRVIQSHHVHLCNNTPA